MLPARVWSQQQAGAATKASATPASHAYKPRPQAEKEAGPARCRNFGAGPAVPAEPVSGSTGVGLVVSGRCCSGASGAAALPAETPPAGMSGFSPELIDYLEGKISFEEFERRREERKTGEKKVSRCSALARPPTSTPIIGGA